MGFAVDSSRVLLLTPASRALKREQAMSPSIFRLTGAKNVIFPCAGSGPREIW